MTQEDMVDSSAKRDLIINELIRGREITKQLQTQLIMADEPPPPSSFHESLVQQIIMSFDKALKILLSGAVADVPPPGVAARSEDSQLDFEVEGHKFEGSKKRKSLPQWTTKVHEGHADDGYIWRKYGQKDIFGAKFPRNYYRCTYRDQGCQATKQVQKTDEDPSLFQVIYRGTHCCSQASTSHNPPFVQQPTHILNYQQQNQPQTQSHEVLLSFQTGLEVQTSTDQNFVILQQPSSSFSFQSSSSSNTATAATDTHRSMLDDHSSMGQQNAANLRASVTAAVTSATNSPTPDPDFSFDHLGFDLDFVFLDPSFFY